MLSLFFVFLASVIPQLYVALAYGGSNPEFSLPQRSLEDYIPKKLHRPKVHSSSKSPQIEEKQNSFTHRNLVTPNQIGCQNNGWQKITAVGFSLNGNLFAMAQHEVSPNREQIHIYNTHTCTAVVSFTTTHTDTVSDISFSPDESFVASASKDDVINIFHIPSREHSNTLLGHSDSVTTIDFSPDGKFLVSGDDDGEMRLWDLDTDQSELLLQESNTILDVSFSPDGQYIGFGTKDGIVSIIEMKSRTKHILISILDIF